MNRLEIAKRAKDKLRRITKARRDPRFLETLGILVAEGHLQADGVTPQKGRLRLEDALWAGQWEPRILEILPALYLKKPRLFLHEQTLPHDFQQVLQAIRRAGDAPTFRGIPAALYQPWIERIGRRNKRPTLTKAFRFTAKDLERIREICERDQVTETEAVRNGLQLLLEKQ